MSVSFTGERLHEGNELFGVDLARHRAAYCFAAERAAGGRGHGAGAAGRQSAGAPNKRDLTPYN